MPLSRKKSPQKKLYLASYKGTRSAFFAGLFNRVCRWGLNSPYSHSELVVCKVGADIFEGKHAAYSAEGAYGVRMKYIHFEPKKWDVVPLPYEANAVDNFERAIKAGVKYDTLGLLAHAFPVIYRLCFALLHQFRKSTKGRKFCSEAVFDFYFNSDEGWRFDPASLHALMKNL